MWGQQPYGMHHGMNVDASSGYQRVMPAYNRGNHQCSEKGVNRDFVMLVVLFILLIIVGSTYYLH